VVHAGSEAEGYCSSDLDEEDVGIKRGDARSSCVNVARGEKNQEGCQYWAKGKRLLEWLMGSIILEDIGEMLDAGWKSSRAAEHVVMVEGGDLSPLASILGS
jgi:hypothetical protein